MQRFRIPRSSLVGAKLLHSGVGAPIGAKLLHSGVGAPVGAKPLMHGGAGDDFSTISIFNIDEALIENKKSTKWKGLLSKYSQAASKDDNDMCLSILHDMAAFVVCNSEGGGTNQEFVQYIECFRIWLKLVVNGKSFTVITRVRKAVEDYERVIRERQKMGLKNGFQQQEEDDLVLDILKAILLSYHLAKEFGKSSLFTVPIEEYFAQIAMTYKVDLNGLRSKLTEKTLIKALDTITRFDQAETHIKTESDELQKNSSSSSSSLPSPSPQSPLPKPIESYLEDSGALQFHRACDYILENKFQWKGGEIKIPIYKFYENLEKQEKGEFMTQYLQFNTIKQANLEKYLHRIIKSNLNSNEQERRMAFFKKEKNYIESWVDLTTSYIEENFNFSERPASQDEKLLFHFQPFFKVFPMKSIICHIIYTLMGRVGDKRIPLSELLDRWRFVYVRQIATSSSSNIKNLVLQYTSEKSFDELSHLILDAVMKSCKIRLTNSELSFLEQETPKNVMMPFLSLGNSGHGHEHEHEREHEHYAFRSEVEQHYTKRARLIRIHPALIRDLESTSYYGEGSNFPLLCPPKQWIGPKSGGYLSYPVNFVTGFDKLQRFYLQKAHIQGKLDRAFLCLDQMGKTAWSINGNMLKVFNSIMQLPNGFLNVPRPLTKGKCTQEVSDLNNQRKFYEAINRLANAYGINGDAFYNCYMFDFRGRAYPLSMLNHYGEDLIRSLFQFYESRPLGKSGFYWLKYQAASLFEPGSEASCEQFFEKHKEDIINSAKRPLDNNNNNNNNNKWWMKADQPFQLLAVCFEIANVLKHIEESGGNGDAKIEQYLCRLPIHQDGTCNGLQHYAGLARDKSGAKSVNLIPSETKQDVYSEIRDLVEKKILEDINKFETQEEIDNARFKLEILSRKIVKRPVMTSVYGVSGFGAKLQIKNEIRDIVDNFAQNPSRCQYDESVIFKLKSFTMKDASYLVNKIFASIDELFVNAKKIEKWLVHTSDRILNSYNIKTLDYLASKNSKLLNTYFNKPVNYSPISWISPVGFPVVQVYRKPSNATTRGKMGYFVIDNTDRHTPADRRKHKLAIAPNFIHSLDASHMAMTCDAAVKNGLTFASIHDSYWTHACDMEKLSSILREKFVELHSFDYMKCVKEDLENQVKSSYQLVYFEKEKYRELYEKVKEIRRQYGEKTIAQQMSSELRSLSSMSYEDHQVSKLIKQYEPILYYVQGSKTFEYNSNFPMQIDRKLKKKVPVFVPVRIMDLPSKGDLDINLVLKSRFFFS
ncbi:hypothetical protein KGF56_002093 [Candida oxycetoniae]|uniref:DNA-directed RNA polymerase n=1 Tax=Candida oxycetoniae TaxID=497107 RepID=A0AAI9WY95_9ASCO|nr:uncharacterized protein KGF56_002093 [Candida oxycetoniae]KAI3405137.2 hypothetical protein KGF56_002093 [Candida oxycetoniae]